MTRKYKYIKNPLIYAVYIHPLQLLIITTNEDGQDGIIYIK